MKSKLSSAFLGFGCLTFFISIAVFVYLLFAKSIGGAFLYGLLWFIAALSLLGFSAKIDENQQKKHRRRLQKLSPTPNSLKNDTSYISADLRKKIILDQHQQMIYIYVPEDPTVKTLADVCADTVYTLNSYPFKDLLILEKIVNQQAILTLSRKSPEARFWISDFPNAQYDEERHETFHKQIHRITLKCTFQHPTEPVQLIDFYINPSKALESADYELLQQDIEKWIIRLSFIMKSCDQREGYIDYGSMMREKQEVDGKSQLIRRQLLPLLNQVAMHKLNNTTVTSSSNTQAASSYFDEILKKNRDSMHRK